MTTKEGYYAAYYFLLGWHRLVHADELAGLLSMMEPLEDGIPADPVMWDYWEEAVARVAKEGPPPPKKLTRPQDSC